MGLGGRSFQGHCPPAVRGRLLECPVMTIKRLRSVACAVGALPLLVACQAGPSAVPVGVTSAKLSIEGGNEYLTVNLGGRTTVERTLAVSLSDSQDGIVIISVDVPRSSSGLKIVYSDGFTEVVTIPAYDSARVVFDVWSPGSPSPLAKDLAVNGAILHTAVQPGEKTMTATPLPPLCPQDASPQSAATRKANDCASVGA